MKPIRRVTVKKHERALLMRNGDFDRVLHPGHHWFFSPVDDLHTEHFPLDRPAFTHPLADYLLAADPDLVAADFDRVDLGDTEVGLRHEHGRLVEVLPPGTRRLYWKGPPGARVDVVDIADAVDVPPAVAAHLVGTDLRARSVAGLEGVLLVQVPDHAAGLLSVDGAVVRRLAPGPHAFWRFNRAVAVEVVDLRPRALEVPGQDTLTRDRVPLRLNLSASWRVTDPLCARAQFDEAAPHVSRELQFGLRAAVGTRTLDELLADQAAVDDQVAGHVRARLWAHGVSLDTVGVKDIVLPAGAVTPA